MRNITHLPFLRTPSTEGQPSSKSKPSAKSVPSTEASQPSSTSAITSQPAQPKTLSRSEQLSQITDLLSGQAKPAAAQEAAVDPVKPAELDESDPRSGKQPVKSGLSDLLGDETHGDPGPKGADGKELAEGDPGAEPGAEAKKAPKSLTELAESSGLGIEALYDMEVVTGDGETVTIGKLKDAFQNQEASAQEIAVKAADLNERESAMIQEQAIWGQIGDQFNSMTTPEQRIAIRDGLKAKAVTERAALVRAAPELSNKTSFEAFTADAVKLAGNYGIKPHEVVLTDHRQVLLLRGFLKSLKVISDLRKFKPKAKVGGKTVSKGRDDAPGGKQKRAATTKQSTHGQRVSAVADLLKGL